jgi:hypothetical protein
MGIYWSENQTEVVRANIPDTNIIPASVWFRDKAAKLAAT